MAALGGTGLLAPAVQADPGCQNGGALIMWARGSGQTFRAPIFTSFNSNVGNALGSIPHQNVELGNEDGNFQLDGDREYPAVDVFKFPPPSAYFNSREIGTNGLVAYLNSRATRCPQEAVILGGFSQGADVVGGAILREGYGALSGQAKRQLAVVAQYGDPSHFSGRGILAGRARPDFLLSAGRIGSWCDVNDFVCNYADPWNFPWGSSHGSIYTDRYIPDTSRWIADLAKSKITELRPAPTPLPPLDATPLPYLPLIGVTVDEQQGRFGATTFANTSATTPGPRVNPAQWVDVSCKVHDPTIASVNPDGYWYRIASAPWNDQYYAAANTFMNGDPWGGPYSHPTDLAVPNCAGAGATPPPPPPPPPAGATYPETTGGATNTWTNYTNAGGTQGPTITSNTTVQIACKLAGFKVANGNTWWYRIASSPWNNAYYSSADAFYNNGQTSGTLVGTPYVDDHVPNC